MCRGVMGPQAFEEQAVNFLETFRSEQLGEGQAVIQYQRGRRFRSGHVSFIFRMSEGDGPLILLTTGPRGERLL